MMNARKTPSTARPANGAARRVTANKRPSRWLSIFAGAALVAMVVVAYAPLRNADYIWDDDAYVTDNLTLRSADGLRCIWFEMSALPQYYPMVHTTFWIEYHLWKLDPLGYHVVNVLMHATSVVLLWRLLTRLETPGAWLAAAIFAVHPVEVESVAWITERKNVLSLTLALSSMLCYFRFAPPQAANDQPTNATRWRWYALALLCFTGALLSKTVVAALPAVVLVIIWWKRGRIERKDVIPLAPFFAVGAGLGLLTVWLEQHHVGALGEIYEWTPIERLLIAGRALWFYAAKLVLPYPLAFFYPRWTIDTSAAWQYLFPAAAVALLVALWLARGRIGRGPLAAVLIFGGVLFPALGFLNVYPFRYSFVADHFQYHASVALLSLLAASVALAVARVQTRRPQVALGVTVVPLIVLGLLTFDRARFFDNSEVLFRDTIVKSPDCWGAYTILETYLDAHGRCEEALAIAREAMARASKGGDPDDPVDRDGLATAHNNLSACVIRLGNTQGFQPGQLDEALLHVREALRLDPTSYKAFGNLATIMLEGGRQDEVIQELDRALANNPDDGRFWHVKGVTYYRLNQLDKASECFRKALELAPRYPEAELHLALTLNDQGNSHEAAAHLRAALRVNPNLADAHYLLAGILANQGDLRQAAEHYQAAIAINPQNADAHAYLGQVLLNLGETENAIRSFENSLRINPQDARAQANLKRALEIRQTQPAAPPWGR